MGGGVLIGLVVVVERRAAQPMLDPSLFTAPTVTPAPLAAPLPGPGNYTALLLVII